MRYLVAAALAAVLVLPPAGVSAGPSPIGPGVFIFLGADAEGNTESLACFDVGGSKSWLILEATNEAGTEGVVLAGDGAKVGKGPRFKDKGAMRRLDVVDDGVRPRGTTTTGSDVTGTMKASYNAKTDTPAATATDKTNGQTLEGPGGSVLKAYQATNITQGVEICKAAIEQLESQKDASPQSLLSLLAAHGIRLR
jgi:hypothetical protein